MRFTQIAGGYGFLEAPRADGEAVWFADLLAGGLRRLWPGGRIETLLADHKNIGGVALDETGAVICGGQSGLSWLDPKTGSSGVLLDTVGGERLSGVNDIYPDGKGGLYFGTLSRGGDYGEPPTLTSLCHVDAEGRGRKLADGLRFANGLGLSPDGRRLYHVESLEAVFVYDVQPDGGLTNKTRFAAQEDGDGLAVDAAGCVWVASFASGQLVRYRPDGSLDARVPAPHKVVTSLCFGGADGRDLYVTTGGNDGVERMLKGEPPLREASLFHARVETPGLPVPRTRFRILA
jgi:sugar lactone lactonase YvrE